MTHRAVLTGSPGIAAGAATSLSFLVPRYEVLTIVLAALIIIYAEG
jgi:hypothetical protein